MELMNLIDGQSALIVGGGTVVATALRAGLSNCATTVREFSHLMKPKFNAEAARSELAIHIQKIQKDGLVRAHPHHFGDSEFDEATDAFIEKRSISALLERHEAHRANRMTLNERATQTLSIAAELSPVFGLAGTLISLNQVSLNHGATAGQGLFAAISMAVVTTLYGIIASHLLFAPMARFLERRAAVEEADRQMLIDWLSGQLQSLCKPGGSRVRGNDHAQ